MLLTLADFEWLRKVKSSLGNTLIFHVHRLYKTLQRGDFLSSNFSLLSGLAQKILKTSFLLAYRLDIYQEEMWCGEDTLPISGDGVPFRKRMATGFYIQLELCLQFPANICLEAELSWCLVHSPRNIVVARLCLFLFSSSFTHGWRLCHLSVVIRLLNKIVFDFYGCSMFGTLDSTPSSWVVSLIWKTGFLRSDSRRGLYFVLFVK